MESGGENSNTYKISKSIAKLKKVVFIHFLLSYARHTLKYINLFCNLLQGLLNTTQDIEAELRGKFMKKWCHTEIVDFCSIRGFMKLTLIWGENKNVFNYRRDFYMMLGRALLRLLLLFFVQLGYLRWARGVF